MASRDFFFPSDLGFLAGFGVDDFDYWNDPEIIIDPINCMVAAVIPRSARQVPEPRPSRPRRSRNGLQTWRATLARWLTFGKRRDVHRVFN
jgi:hypothetical protein